MQTELHRAWRLLRPARPALAVLLAAILAYGCTADSEADDGSPSSECADYECENGGECTVTDGEPSCECSGGYSGERCEDVPNECEPNPCESGGECVVTDDGYECECNEGYSGDRCEEAPAACSPNPCQNGGSCSSDGDDGYECRCEDGYTGDECEEAPAACSPNPCQNDGLCVLGSDGEAECRCESGYTSDECEEAPAACSPNPCQNDGACAQNADGFFCTCTGGFSGETCEEAPNGCSPNPCQNEGTCALADSGYSCDCLEGYSGDNCESVPAACLPNPCENGGVCSGNDEEFICDCPIAFVGETCEDAASSGLTDRPANTTCIAPERAASSGPLVWVDFASLGPGEVMMIRQAPTRHWYEAYRNGDIYVLSPDGTRTSSPILSIPTSTDSEMGMWGLALHPNFSSDPFIYLYYSDLGGPDNTGRGIVARYRVDSPTTSPSIDPSSREEIFVYERGNTAQYHWGGTIEFHPTSAGAQLYLATGNAGVFDQTACDFADPPDSANGVCPEQYLATYLGKLIRFDVTDTSDGATYTPEIVGLGLRNPFRWSFDTGTGDLWIGDVGDSAWEELTYVPNAMIPGPGEEALNFGFPCFEGFEAYMGGSLCDALTETVEPIHAYGRDVGVSIIGGRVYRGSNIAGIAGTYFFNDYFPQTGFIPWILRGNPSDDPTDPTDAYQREELEGWAFYGYTEDIDGELYGLHQGLWRLEATGDPAAEETMASSLSGTGCFDGSGNPTGGMIPFEVRAPLWSDGASKRRWLSIPDGTNITLDADGDFVFPNGTILAKEFTQNGVRVETRLLVRHPDGAWEGYTYAWMDEGGNLLDDAELISSDSSTRTIPGSSEDWVYPSRGQCETCHTQAAGFALGPEVAQLNYPYTYPDGESTNSQIHTLSAIGILESPVDSYRESMRLASYDEETSEERLAQAYLHSNCGGCHREGAPGFGGRSTMPDIVYRPGASNSSLTQLFCGVGWGTEHLGLGEDAQLVQPGVPGTWDNLDDGGSLLYLRTGARDNVPGSSGAMPPLGSRLVDEEGMRLLSDWITQLDCP